MYTELEKKIEEIVTPSLDELGFRLVRIKLSDGSDNGRTLQIMAERTQDGRMIIDDCAKVSRALSAILDVEDPIAGEYNLEVSSPGMDRPLVKLEDFEQFSGYLVKFQTSELIEGRKKFKGVLEGIDDEEILVSVADRPDEPIKVPYRIINSANLVITDALLKEASNKQNVN